MLTCWSCARAEYRLISKKGEGTFSEVLKAHVSHATHAHRACVLRQLHGPACQWALSLARQWLPLALWRLWGGAGGRRVRSALVDHLHVSCVHATAGPLTLNGLVGVCARRRAQSIKNGKYLAIKCMKSHFESIEQVNSLREIQALRRLSPYPHIIKLYEVL